MKYELNKIYLIESIPPNEAQTGAELFQDTIEPYNRFHKSNIELYFKKAFDKGEFLESLKFVLENISFSDKIILHLEAHGSRDKKKMILSNDDEISWSELTEYLIPINRKCKNNLVLFNLSCFGNYISQLIDLRKTAPFKSFIGSQHSIYPFEIISYYTALYERIIKSKDPYKAIR